MIEKIKNELYGMGFYRWNNPYKTYFKIDLTNFNTIELILKNEEKQISIILEFDKMLPFEEIMYQIKFMIRRFKFNYISPNNLPGSILYL